MPSMLESNCQLLSWVHYFLPFEDLKVQVCEQLEGNTVSTRLLKSSKVTLSLHVNEPYVSSDRKLCF